MLNANYISLFGMQRVDIMIRQKFLNDLRDLQEINDCFRNESSLQGISPIKPSPLHSIMPTRYNQNKIKKKESLKLPKLSSEKTKSEFSSNNKSSKNKEDAKQRLEKKTNANVYFWYYKEDPKVKLQQNQAEKQKLLPKQTNLKLPSLSNRELIKKRRKLSINSNETLDSLVSTKQDEPQLPNISEQDDKSTVVSDQPSVVSKPFKLEIRPPSVASVASIESEADFFTFKNKRRVILKTAQLKQLNVSPKFMSEAKKMVFLPACKSFHPISVTKYVSETVR